MISRDRSRLTPAGFLAATLLLAACSGDKTAIPAIVARVTIDPPTASILVGGSTTLAARATDAAGNALTGLATTWTSSAPGVATVNNGTVNGLSAGSVTISAAVSGISGSATVTVTAAVPVTTAITAGDNQRGLVARPLADSLTIRVSAGGAPQANVPVAWATNGGTLSSSSTTTNSAGLARVQWSVGSGDVTATATPAGLAPLTFRANGRPSGACTIAPSAQTQRFSLGATDFTLSLRSTQPLRIAVLFVDFTDAVAGSETPAALMSSIIDSGLALLREMSYNRINITAVSFPTWYRMPSPLASYDWTTFAGHRQYLLDVLAVTNPAIDFSTFDALYVFTPNSSIKPISPTFNGGTTANVVADGRNFGNAVTFGADSRNFGPAILAHETGHMLGLVDLYAFTPAGGTNYAGNQFKFVGAWSLMSNVFNPAHYLTWEKRKLGFIDETQVDCLDGTGGVESIITPNQVTGGLKMVAVPLDASSALVIEVRNALGLDANLCAQGVLIYAVDARIPSGTGAAQVLGSRVTTSGPAFVKCGPWADGIFSVGASAVSTFTHVASGTTVTVLSQEANGAFRVRVKR